MTQLKTQPKILPLADRVQIIFSVVEEAMTKLQRIGTRPTRIPLSPAAIEKRQREAREELRREVERLVRGRGRDMLGLVRQFATEAADTFDVGEAEAYQSVSAVPLDSLLSVIDAGFIAEDEPVAGERCPLCERDVSDHTRVDMYGEDVIICMGSTRVGLVVGHPQALSRLHEAATREAQRQFDEMTKGSEARHKAEDYAAILDVLAEVPAEQLEGLEWEEGSAEFAPIVRQLLTRGPLLERERLEGVVRDAVRQSLAPLNLKVVDRKFVDIDDVDSEVEYAEAVAGLVANLLKAIFPVRVEYVSQEESERVERARKIGDPPRVLEQWKPESPTEEEKFFLTPTIKLPYLPQGATHWLIGNDYGLFYKVDAAGNVTRLENEHTSLQEEAAQ